MNSLGWFPLVGSGAAVVALAVGIILGRNRKTPEDRERERRQRLNTGGRITIGNILDVQEITNNADGPLQMLIYHYDVAGVSYEASQDVTHLRQYIDLHACRMGLPTSIRYDPKNPGDSIVVSEHWSGIQQMASR
jgi:hypothetical protein